MKEMDYKIMIAYMAGIILLFFVGRMLLVPIKVILRGVISSCLGGGIILIINLVGGIFGFSLPFNLLSSFIVGIFGIPGVILLLILKFSPVFFV